MDASSCPSRTLATGRRRDELRQQAEEPFAVVRCEAVPATAADAYARIKLNRQRQGLSLDENDLWIAATALALDAVLVTRDSDFDSLEEIVVVDWST